MEILKNYLLFGELNQENNFCKIACSKETSEHILNYSNIKGEYKDYAVYFYKNNALDFLSLIFDKTSEKDISNEKLQKIYIQKYNEYVKFSELVKCFWSKTIENATSPMKKRASDIGWDLCLQKEVWRKDNMIMYDTGIAFDVPYGYYIQIYPRSSLSKSGYVLGNSVGIIDRGYTDSVKVVLVKHNQDVPDLELPYRAVQAVLVPAFHSLFLEQQEKAVDTERAGKGFGSSGYY